MVAFEQWPPFTQGLIFLLSFWMLTCCTLYLSDCSIRRFWKKRIDTAKDVACCSGNTRVTLVVAPVFCFLVLRICNYLVRSNREAILWVIINICMWYVVWDYYRVVGVSVYSQAKRGVPRNLMGTTKPIIVEDVTAVEVTDEGNTTAELRLSFFHWLAELIVQILGFVGSCSMGYLTLPTDSIAMQMYPQDIIFMLQLVTWFSMLLGMNLQYYWGATTGRRFKSSR